jgi:PAS domain S-box-containing protein
LARCNAGLWFGPRLPIGREVTINAHAGRTEAARLEALLDHRILDTPREQAFDDLVELAAAVCNTPVAAIAFVDGSRSWLKAKHGVDVSEFPRELALSAEALRHTDLFVVPDALKDERYRSSPLVSQGYRFFAGMALVSPEGHALGTVCVLDERPRKLSATQKDALRAIARQVMSQLELRRISQAESSGEHKFRVLLEQLPGAVYIEDLGASSGFYFSPQIERLTGYSAGEWASEADFFSRVLHPEDRGRVLGAMKRAHETHGPIQIEYRIVAKDGHVVWIQDDAEVARNKDGQPRYFQGLMTDVTKRRALASEHDDLLERVRAQNERLLDVDRLKDELLAMVSHELRTPLTSIIGYLDLVCDGDTLTGEQRGYLKVVDNNAHRLLTLVSDLLFVAQAQAGPVVVERDLVPVGGVVEQAVVAARPAAVARGVDLTLHSSAGANVVGDAQRLGQVVDNLLSNAVKFTPAGGSVAVRVLSSGEQVLIEVADSGMGMEAADQEALFTRFYRTESARKSAIQGTGLGLSIVKAIVDAHGGEVTVDSAAGKGTTFRVFLPQAPILAAVPVERAA